jgi:predicted PurR-regulated permease PerM
LFLFYKPLLLNFVAQVFDEENSDKIKEVLESTKNLIQSYLVGLLIEMVIVAVLNSVSLLIIGVEYALALGVIGALLNLIPYIGGLVAIALPFTMAILNGSFMSGVAVIAVYVLIQIIDNNVLVPMIVASKVKINALFSIIVVLIGGAMWGVAGMFLAIPLTAIVKVVFDNIPSMKPYGTVLGDVMPQTPALSIKVEDIKKAEDESSAS